MSQNNFNFTLREVHHAKLQRELAEKLQNLNFGRICRHALHRIKRERELRNYTDRCMNMAILFTAMSVWSASSQQSTVHALRKPVFGGSRRKKIDKVECCMAGLYSEEQYFASVEQASQEWQGLGFSSLSEALQFCGTVEQVNEIPDQMLALFPGMSEVGAPNNPPRWNPEPPRPGP